MPQHTEFEGPWYFKLPDGRTWVLGGPRSTFRGPPPPRPLKPLKPSHPRGNSTTVTEAQEAPDSGSLGGSAGDGPG